MDSDGGFEHNQQSLRIVELLESKYPTFQGLNLSLEVRAGIQKHKTPFDQPKELPGLDFISLEAQVVNLADEITYTSHDVDDAIRSNIISDSDLINHVSIWREYSNQVLSEHANITENQYIYLMNSKLITSQIMNVIDAAKSQFKSQGFIPIQIFNNLGTVSLNSHRNLEIKLTNFVPIYLIIFIRTMTYTDQISEVR